MVSLTSCGCGIAAVAKRQNSDNRYGIAQGRILTITQIREAIHSPVPGSKTGIEVNAWPL
jgi:hypothetical protein